MSTGASCRVGIFDPDGLAGSNLIRGGWSFDVYDALGVPHVVTFQAFSPKEWAALPIPDRPKDVVIGLGGVRLVVRFDRR